LSKEETRRAVVITQVIDGSMTISEAAEVLDLSERQDIHATAVAPSEERKFIEGDDLFRRSDLIRADNQGQRSPTLNLVWCYSK